MTEEHKGSRGTYDFIAKWCNARVPFSLNDDWHRFGILGVLGDMILQYLPGTNILEIGTGESSIYFTRLVEMHNRIFYTCDNSYGKIYNPSTIPHYLPDDRVILNTNSADGYEFHQGVLFVGDSDDFFKKIKFKPIGLGFIDGDHHYEQVKKDFDNIFPLLVDDGIVFLHDTYPPNENLVLNDYCSDAYKMRQELEKRDDVDCFTFTKSVACNAGLTMVRKKKKDRPYYHE